MALPSSSSFFFFFLIIVSINKNKKKLFMKKKRRTIKWNYNVVSTVGSVVRDKMCTQFCQSQMLTPIYEKHKWESTMGNTAVIS